MGRRRLVVPAPVPARTVTTVALSPLHCIVQDRTVYGSAGCVFEDGSEEWGDFQIIDPRVSAHLDALEATVFAILQERGKLPLGVLEPVAVSAT